MKDVITGLIAMYIGGFLGTSILFMLGKIGLFTKKRRKNRR